MSKPPERWDRLRRAYRPVSEAPKALELYDPRHHPEIARDMAEERAAILEFDAGFSREEAERRAFTKPSRRFAKPSMY
jgi:hypothetical protein